jgi:hypothetical protein
LNHFGVIEVPDAQKYRDLKTARRTIDLKGHTNLSSLLASSGCLDACHFNLKFAHRLTQGLDRLLSIKAP